jgi:hypothetical protein
MPQEPNLSKMDQSPGSPVLCHFASPEEQLQTMRELARERPWTYAWGLKESDFRDAENAMPGASDYGLDEKVVIQLVPYLRSGDGLNPEQRTFRDLWNLARTAYAEYHCSPLVDHDGKFSGLSLMPGAKHRPGLRWETIILETNLLANPFEVRRVQNAPHAGVMAIAAFQPKAFSRLKHCVVIPGYDIKTVLDLDFSLPGEKLEDDEPAKSRPKASALCLGYDHGDPGINLFSQRMDLDADEMVKKNADFNWFVPSFV